MNTRLVLIHLSSLRTLCRSVVGYEEARLAEPFQLLVICVLGAIPTLPIPGCIFFHVLVGRGGACDTIRAKSDCSGLSFHKLFTMATGARSQQNYISISVWRLTPPMAETTENYAVATESDSKELDVSSAEHVRDSHHLQSWPASPPSHVSP